jgi:hypothetical protein
LDMAGALPCAGRARHRGPARVSRCLWERRAPRWSDTSRPTDVTRIDRFPVAAPGRAVAAPLGKAVTGGPDRRARPLTCVPLSCRQTVNSRSIAPRRPGALGCRQPGPSLGAPKGCGRHPRRCRGSPLPHGRRTVVRPCVGFCPLSRPAFSYRRTRVRAGHPDSATTARRPEVLEWPRRGPRDNSA